MVGSPCHRQPCPVVRHTIYGCNRENHWHNRKPQTSSSYPQTAEPACVNGPALSLPTPRVYARGSSKFVRRISDWCVSIGADRAAQPSESQPPPGSDERWVGGRGSEPARSAVRISRGCSPRSTPAATRVGGETRRPASGPTVPILPVLTRQGLLNRLCMRWAATAAAGMPAEI